MNMAEPVLSEELARMKEEYEPLLPIERKLIWFTFGVGVFLLVVLVILSRAFV